MGDDAAGKIESLEMENQAIRKRLANQEGIFQSLQYSMNTFIYLSFEDPDDLLDTLISMGCSMFKAEEGAIFYGGEDSDPVLAASFNISRGDDPEKISFVEGLLGHVASDRQALVCRSWDESPELRDLERPGFMKPPFVLVSVDIQDKPAGIMYFGFNDETADSVLPEPHTFKLYSGIAATAINNSIALGRASAMARELKNQKDELESKNDDLEAKTAELEEYVATIQAQQEEIQRLGTPVISLWDRILCMPLIGVLDSSRSQQCMEVLLNRIIEEKARIAIIDITGVPLVDTLVANHLTQTAAAVRLIGAESILTGISPGVAQTLVKMGVDITGISTKRTLADGLSFALQKLGEKKHRIL